MDVRYAAGPRDARLYDTERLRQEFLIQDLFLPGAIKLVYSHMDRIIVGGVCPVAPIKLEAGKEISAEYFLERREMGLINIGSAGTVRIDGEDYNMNPRDGLYIGRGNKEVIFKSNDPAKPAKFYFNSTPAHMNFPTVKIDISKAQPQQLGSAVESNQRTIYKFIHPEVAKSCQLLMGMTILEPNNVWNTMPCHTHDRRMEVYLYFDLPADGLVFHYMGEPWETRHLVMRNEEAVICPSWSIHTGVGTRNYTFIWGMAGENQVFQDMDGVAITELK